MHLTGNIIVGQSGGPTAVINASVAGVYKAGKELGANKVYGMVNGIQGFLQENILDYFVPAYMFFDVKLDVELG